ncbi:MAG: ATP-dependent 6-phosphofructokinase [Acidimicrobiia bacterium]|nr:ATP-dependent 6-phosphofructokinase [Acidimicrobiia bacterium]MDH4309603.1 ATP-dependent 6-phosphofructokinase [Acidimicrobiia bacterium]MDH5294464.1 ATP-dependent 6-phosphofructokinase [Acidimicrobiia bacterium]
MSTIAVLTAGGDCPGLNAVVRAVVTRVHASGGRAVGVLNGWQGLMDGDTRLMTRDDVRGILTRGGTILGTSRKDPYVHGQGLASIQPTIEQDGIDAVVVIGGDGSLRTAVMLAEEGLRVVGVPKTIDNDIGGTDMTFGFDTAVQIVTDAIDRLTTTAEAHNRIMVVEVMGRTAGWIATAAGMAGGAEEILIPEIAYDLEDVAARIVRRHDHGRLYSIVVVAEGVAPPPGATVPVVVDAFGFERLGGVANVIGPQLERLTGFETRVTILGHLQRGGTPTAFDRILGTRLGVAAAETALDGGSGVMVALSGQSIATVDLAEACREPRKVPPERYEEARWFLA